MLGFVRTSTLESVREDLEEEVEEAEERAEEANIERREVEESLAAALDAGEFEPLQHKWVEVETLDEPRAAYKRTKNQIVKLVIPAGETVVHPSTSHRKKRVSKAYVEEIRDLDNTECNVDYGYSFHDPGFAYREGEFVEPRGHDLDKSTMKTCTYGIHCFCKVEHAQEYY